MSVFAGRHGHRTHYPLAYLVSVGCYGALRQHLGGAPSLCEFPYYLDSARRPVTLKSVRDTCRARNWTLMAACVSTSGFEAVLGAARTPSVVVNKLKQQASEHLRRTGLDGNRIRRWETGAVCRFIWRSSSAEKAIEAVLAASANSEQFRGLCATLASGSGQEADSEQRRRPIEPPRRSYLRPWKNSS